MKKKHIEHLFGIKVIIYNRILILPIIITNIYYYKTILNVIFKKDLL